jgi:hypothetical protein
LCHIKRLPNELVCDRDFSQTEKDKLLLILELNKEDFYVNSNYDIYYRPPSYFTEEFNVTIWHYSDLMNDSLMYKKELAQLVSNLKLDTIPDLDIIKKKRRKNN